MALIDMDLTGKLGAFYTRMREFRINGCTPFPAAPRGLSGECTQIAHGLAVILSVAEDDAGLPETGDDPDTLFGVLNPELRSAGPKAIHILLSLAAFFNEEEWRAMRQPYEPNVEPPASANDSRQSG